MKKPGICDLGECGILAIYHVRFGFSANLDKTPEVSFHGEFCQKHIDNICTRFNAVSLFDLGTCPDGCDGNSDHEHPDLHFSNV